MSATTVGRVFACHYQLMITDDPTRSVSDDENWDDSKIAQGYAGDVSCRLVGTEADLNDHWIELCPTNTPPIFGEWQRVTCVHFRSKTGLLNVMSVVDAEPALSIQVDVGDYSIYVAGKNLGVDLLSLGEDVDLSDSELAARKDLEWYKIFVVPGRPTEQGRLKDA